MEWKQIEGYQAERPAEVDTTSSRSTIYLRRNIEEVPNVDPDGTENEGTHWRYEEVQIAVEDFGFISQVLAMENQRAMDETLAEILLNQNIAQIENSDKEAI